jgi:hypothetical protein
MMIAAAPLLLLAWFDILTGWLLVGVGLALATIVLASLLRTRWRQAKPWKKCALLSLWVHLLLAYLATVVQIASHRLGYGPGYGPGFGQGPPIQVALLSETEITPMAPVVIVAEQSAEAADDEQAALEENAGEVNVEGEESEPAKETGNALEAPELLTELAPAPAVEQEPDKAPVEASTQNSEAQDTVAIDAKDSTVGPTRTDNVPAHPSLALPLKGREPEQTKDEAATDPSANAQLNLDHSGHSAEAAPSRTAKATAASVPNSYAERFAANRDQLVAGGGGNATTEQSVRAALAWLAAAQSEDGRWDAKRHGAGQEWYVLGQDRGGAGAKADTGVTGLALLAMLGAGHTHRDGPHTAEVARGLDFLRRSQRPNGNLSGDAEMFAQMYCHSMASFAVSECFAITKDERLAPMVKAAVGYSLAVQHPTDGGWRYRPGDTGDTSQLGWAVMALKSAELGGVAVPQVTWTRVDRFLRQVERGHAGGLAAYRPEGPPTRPMTAESLYCRQLLTGRADGQLSRAAVDEALASLLTEPPSPTAVNLYYWYYATLALHHVQHVSPEAEDAWRRWNEALTRSLLSTQREDGSWPETCLWGGYGGRVFTTSLAAMCLEVYYRYAPSRSLLPEGTVSAGRRVTQR